MHQRQHRLVGIVRQQVAALRNPLIINRILLKEAHRPEGNRRRQDQRNQQRIAAGNLGDQEDGRHRRLHHPRHQRRHPHEHEILLRHAGPDEVERAGHDEAQDGSGKQGRAEGTADSPAGIGRRHRQDLQEEDQREEHRHAPGAVQQEIQHAAAVQGQIPAIEQGPQRIIALAVERREQEDQQAERSGAECPAQIRIAPAPDPIFECERGAHEIQGAEAADHAQDDVERDISHRERGQGAGEDRGLSSENVGDHRGGDRSGQQRQERRHRHVEEQNLQGEQDPGQGGLEDARHGAGGAAAQQQGDVAIRQARGPAQVRTDGGTGIDNRRLGTHRAAEADGDARGQDRRPGVVRLDLGVIARDGQQGLRHAVTDVVPDHIAHQQQGDQHTDAGKDQVLPVVATVEALVEQALHRVDGPVKNDGGAPREYADHQTEQQEPAAFRDIFQGNSHYASAPSSSPPYWEILSSGRVSPSEADAEVVPATDSASASSSPSSQRSMSSRLSIWTLILTR